jgi:hypothetical protein
MCCTISAHARHAGQAASVEQAQLNDTSIRDTATLSEPYLHSAGTRTCTCWCTESSASTRNKRSSWAAFRRGSACMQTDQVQMLKQCVNIFLPQLCSVGVVACMCQYCLHHSSVWVMSETLCEHVVVVHHCFSRSHLPRLQLTQQGVYGPPQLPLHNQPSSKAGPVLQGPREHKQSTSACRVSE